MYIQPWLSSTQLSRTLNLKHKVANREAPKDMVKEVAITLIAIVLIVGMCLTYMGICCYVWGFPLRVCSHLFRRASWRRQRRGSAERNGPPVTNEDQVPEQEEAHGTPPPRYSVVTEDPPSFKTAIQRIKCESHSREASWRIVVECDDETSVFDEPPLTCGKVEAARSFSVQNEVLICHVKEHHASKSSTTSTSGGSSYSKGEEHRDSSCGGRFRVRLFSPEGVSSEWLPTFRETNSIYFVNLIIQDAVEVSKIEIEQAESFSDVNSPIIDIHLEQLAHSDTATSSLLSEKTLIHFSKLPDKNGTSCCVQLTEHVLLTPALSLHSYKLREETQNENPGGLLPKYNLHVQEVNNFSGQPTVKNYFHLAPVSAPESYHIPASISTPIQFNFQSEDLPHYTFGSVSSISSNSVGYIVKSARIGDSLLVTLNTLPSIPYISRCFLHRSEPSLYGPSFLVFDTKDKNSRNSNLEKTRYNECLDDLKVSREKHQNMVNKMPVSFFRHSFRNDLRYRTSQLPLPKCNSLPNINQGFFQANVRLPDWSQVFYSSELPSSARNGRRLSEILPVATTSLSCDTQKPWDSHITERHSAKHGSSVTPNIFNSSTLVKSNMLSLPPDNWAKYFCRPKMFQGRKREFIVTPVYDKK